MGPMRVNWSFPYSGKELIARCEILRGELIERMDKSLTAEQDHERELAEYREKLRIAGVKAWETAKLDPGGSTYSNLESKFRTKQQAIAKRLQEIDEFQRQLEHDLSRDPERLYKLTIDDVRFFGL
jgi:hypothetical protein